MPDTIKIEPVEFNWSSDSANMSSTTGVTAQEINSAIDTVYIDPGINLNDITITSGPYITGSTITLAGIDDWTGTPTKSEHKELMDRVERLEKMIAEEAELRANHPAVKNAYDEYRLLLVLAKQHTPSILTDE